MREEIAMERPETIVGQDLEAADGTPLSFLFGDVEPGEESDPLRTGDIYGKFDYDDPLLTLREQMLKHSVAEARAGRTGDLSLPLTQLAMSLTPYEQACLMSKDSEAIRRSILLRLAQLSVNSETTPVYLSVLRDETYRCFIALGDEARKTPLHQADIQCARAALLRYALRAGPQPLSTDPRRIIQDMVVARHGGRIWCELTTAAECDLERLRPEDRGPDALAARLIELGADRLGRTRDEFLHDMVSFCNEMVGRVTGNSPSEVLSRLNEVHEAIARIAPKYPLPRFEADEAAGASCFVYDARNVAPWASLLASSLGQRFNVVLHLRPRGEEKGILTRGRISVVPACGPGTATEAPLKMRRTFAA